MAAAGVLRLLWSKTVRRTQKQETPENSSVCLSASEFAELPSPPIFASRAEILSQIQLRRRLYKSSYGTVKIVSQIRFSSSRENELLFRVRWLKMLHAHIFFTAPLGPGNMAKASANKH